MEMMPMNETKLTDSTTLVPETKNPWRPPIPPPAQVLQLAIGKSAVIATGLYDAFRQLEVVKSVKTNNGHEIVEIDASALAWLAKKIRSNAGEIMNHMDNAEHAREGKLYASAADEYGRDAEKLGA
jgi:hypothetical protein